MYISDNAISVDQYLSGHSAQSKKVHFLAIALQDGVGRIGESEEGKPLTFPIGTKGFRCFGADGQNLDPAFSKSCIIPLQLREMPPAKRSEKSPIEHQKYDVFSDIVRQSDCSAHCVNQLKIRSWNIQGNLRHWIAPSRMLLSACNWAHTKGGFRMIVQSVDNRLENRFGIDVLHADRLRTSSPEAG